MSHTGKSIQEMGFDSLTDRFRNTLSCSNIDNNKPDFKELDLGSPVSPLVTRTSGNGAGAGAGGGAAVSSSSSSSSSGSVTGKTNTAQLGRRSDGKANSHSGELSGSCETSPTASDSHRSTATKGNSKPGHRRLGSAGIPLIYSGGSFISTSSSPNNGGAGSGGGCGGNTATSSSSNSATNLFPSGNICPSGKILKPAMASKTPSKNVVLGSGTGNYGHGSIMRGGGGAKLGSPGDANVSGNIAQSSGGEAMLVKRALANSDPEEVKKAGNELYKRGHFVEALSLYDRAISILPDNAAYRSNRAAVLTALGRLGEAVRECEEAVRLDPGYGRAHQRLASLYLR